MQEQDAAGGCLRTVDVDPVARGVVIRDRDKIKTTLFRRCGEVFYGDRRATAGDPAVAVAGMCVEISRVPAGLRLQHAAWPAQVARQADRGAIPNPLGYVGDAYEQRPLTGQR